MLRLRRFRYVVIRFDFVVVSSTSFLCYSGGFRPRFSPNVPEFLQVFDFGNFLALPQSTSLFAGGAMDAIGALTAIFFDLTRSALHASVAPLRLVLLIARAAVVQAYVFDLRTIDVD